MEDHSRALFPRAQGREVLVAKHPVIFPSSADRGAREAVALHHACGVTAFGPRTVLVY